jgi:hypothetical protein
MIHAILAQVHDPLYAAIPVFFAFIAIEAIAYRFEDDEPRRAAATARPTRAPASRWDSGR